MSDIPRELEMAISQRKCVAFVGSGLSAPNYPTWDELISELCSVCTVDYLSDTELDADAYLKLAEQCHAQNPSAYLTKLKEIFSVPIESCPETYRHLIRAPFKGYVTINFDPLLASQSTDIEARVYSYQEGMTIEHLKGNVFYIHGYVKEEGDVVENQLLLTKADFNHAYNPHTPESDLHEFLKPLFKYNTVLFIGCGLNEPPLNKLLEITNKAKLMARERVDPSIIPEHFILLPIEEKFSSKNKPKEEEQRQIDKVNLRYEELGIRVVYFEKKKTGSPYIELLHLLQKWSRIPQADAVSPYAPLGPSAG